MDFNKLYEEMIQHKNEEQAQKMSKYMLNKFEHIGIKTLERREIFKNFFIFSNTSFILKFNLLCFKYRIFINLQFLFMY